MKTASRSISVAEAADLLAKAAVPTLAAIARDERRAPPRLRVLFAALRDKLFDPDLSLERLSRELGFTDRAIWTAFGDAVEEPAWTYVREARLETASRLLLQSSLSVEKIGLWVGYESVTTFRKLLREHLGALPSQHQRRARRLLKRAGPPPRDFDSPEYWERAVAGELSDEEARELDDYLDGLYPEGVPVPTVEDNPWTRLRELLAETLADSLDQLPWPSQRRLARDATWFPDGTFFYELSRRGRAAEDPARGVELALLAIDTMASNGLLDVDPGAAAMAWARLARARWRAGDLPGTEDALAQSTRDFERTPQQDLEPEEEAERSRVTAAFRWFQSRREEALELADYSVAQHRKARSADLGKALWLRAELRASLGEADAALEDLEEARGLLGEVPEEWVELWLRVLVATGNKTEMTTALDDASPGSRRRPSEVAPRPLRRRGARASVDGSARRLRREGGRPVDDAGVARPGGPLPRRGAPARRDRHGRGADAGVRRAGRGRGESRGAQGFAVRGRVRDADRGRPRGGGGRPRAVGVGAAGASWGLGVGAVTASSVAR